MHPRTQLHYCPFFLYVQVCNTRNSNSMDRFLESRSDNGLYFDPSTGKLTTRRHTQNSNSLEEFLEPRSDNGLYFDPSTGKLTTRRDTLNSYSMEEFLEPRSDNGLYVDPSTGKLTTRRSANRIILEHMADPGFMGGMCYPRIEMACNLGFSSHEFTEAVMRTYTGNDKLRQYYKIQSQQTLGERNNRVFVPIWIARNGRSRSPNHLSVAPAWIEHIQQAIHNINNAAPGLCLFITSNESEAKIKIFGEKLDICATEGNILLYPSEHCPVEIRLYDKWTEMKRTSCHELLHALGFGHEHQRRDRDSSVHVQDVEENQYCKSYDLVGITRFDPHSIMMYPEEQEYLRRNSEDSVWVTKPTTEINIEMSELDKVSLNNIYRPCRGPNYSPTRFGRGISGLWYCGRYFGVQTSDHDGYCGPTNGPNCPACRVLRSDRVVSLWKKGKWQGWTGEVYCGRYFGVKKQGHDGYCGPNNGPSCPECDIELLSGN